MNKNPRIVAREKAFMLRWKICAMCVFQNVNVRPSVGSPRGRCAAGGRVGADGDGRHRVVARDQPRTAVPGRVTPRPLEKHQHAVGELHDVHQMDEQPQEPGRDAREAKTAQVRHRLEPADRGHRAKIAIAKWLELLVCAAARRSIRAAYAPCCLATGASAGSGWPSACSSRGHVSDHEDLRMLGEVQPRRDRQPSRAIDRRAGSSRQAHSPTATPARRRPTSTVRASICFGASRMLERDSVAFDAGHDVRVRTTRRRASPALCRHMPTAFRDTAAARGLGLRSRARASARDRSAGNRAAACAAQFRPPRRQAPRPSGRRQR